MSLGGAVTNRLEKRFANFLRDLFFRFEAEFVILDEFEEFDAIFQVNASLTKIVEKTATNWLLFHNCRVGFF